MNNPTLSIVPIRQEDGSYGVNVFVTGLASEKEAEAAAKYIEQLLCGDEIKAQ